AVSRFFSSPIPPLAASSTLFPYTTLFRSRSGRSGFHFFPAHRQILNNSANTTAHFHPDFNPVACLQLLLQLNPAPFSFRIILLRSEEHTSELQSRENLVCRLLLEKKKNKN